MQQTISWVLNYPSGDFSEAERIAKFAPLNEIVELAFELAFEDGLDAERYWNYIYYVVGERNVDLPANSFMDQLDKTLEIIKESLSCILTDSEFREFTDDYEIYEAKLDKYTESLVLTFNLME